MTKTPGVSDYLSEEDLWYLGFTHVGKNTKVSRRSSFYGCSGSIDDHTRIDDFCILKGHIELGPYTHINCFNMISGAKAPVVFKGCTGTSTYVSIYTGSDDHRADTLNNPTIPPEFNTQIEGPVTIGMGVVIGAHAAIMPNVTIGDGAAIGAGSIVSFNVPDGGITRPARTTLLERHRNFERIREFARLLLKGSI